jgi:hypothetical protein
MPCNTPVVLLIFKRPETTQTVFERIRQAQPSTLLVVADGPRIDRLGEAEQCAATRSILDQVDWDCDVRTHFSEINLGCKTCVSSGLDWVFSQVDEAIILEDDCLPSLSFFSFCEQLLAHYRHDQRIMMIGGTNYGLPLENYPYSYYFSGLTPIWGWATWKRAWQHFDGSMQSWPEFKSLGLIDLYCNDEFDKQHWIQKLDDVYAGILDSWAYAWTYSCWQQHGLSVVPEPNLVSNIGFGDNSTHTRTLNGLENLPLQDMGAIHHPPFISAHFKMDQLFFDTYWGGKSIRRNLWKMKDASAELLRLIGNKITVNVKR